MLYRFQIELSDIDRGVYESLDFRIAQHPSETAPYLLSRTLAYCLSYQSGLEFSAKGLSDPDAPAIQVNGSNGAIELWIEIGNPSARKLHKATKAARQVRVYTYKSPEVLIADINANNVHKAHEIEIYSFDAQILLDLETYLEKNNRWSVLIQDGRMSVEVGSQSISSEIRKWSTQGLNNSI
ncbi:MAG: YaeQ family protein [Pseudobdellovibrionaceae bacterium]